MLKNYFRVVLRNMLMHKFFSAINILGMTVGITACLLILIYVQDELSFDRFHQNAGRIYQVGLHGKLGGQEIRVANTCPPLAAAMASEIPEVETSTRVSPLYGTVIAKVRDKAFVEDNLFFVDSNFFSFFSFRLLEGAGKSALTEPNSAVITEKIAKKYFGEENAMGKLMTIGNGDKAYKVTGIVEQAPANSHFRFDFLLSSASNEDLKNTVWLNNWMYTYFKLRPNTTTANFSVKFDGLVNKYVGPEVEKYMGTTLKQMRESGGSYGYFVTRLTDIHLHSTADGDLTPGGNIMYVYSFSVIAAFIIIIACINFMNMSTARSAGRAKEVGLRKTLGSLREQMIFQFLSESLLYALIAMVLALVATYLLIPPFNILAGKELTGAALLSWQFIAGIGTVIVIVGLAAGSYPAFYLTGFNVVEVLKGKVRTGGRSKGIRSSMVVFQFAVSILLIILTTIVYNQLTFMQNRDLGFDKKNVLYLYNVGKLGTSREAFRNSIAGRSDVQAISFTNNSFPGVGNTTVFKAAGNDQDHIMGLFRADYEAQNVMKFKMVAGRYFSKDFPSDSLAIILNEAAVKEFNWTDPLNEAIRYSGDGPIERRLKVIGVYKDFNFESLKDKVRPLAIMLNKTSDLLAVRYNGDPKVVVAGLEGLWKKFAADEPFQYHFLDENYDALFRSEQRLGKIIMIFSGLAIFIACLGLFALAAFTAEQRTKEIGIRKSMGASVSGLAMMMSKEFIMLVLIAFVVVCGPAWYFADWWLKSFAFHVPVNPLIFAGSGLAAVVVAWLTVSFQSLKAASVNPVKSLRYE